MHLVVASLNPVKIAAAEGGFRLLFPQLSCRMEGVSVPSGVPDQPYGEAETWQGAMNRAEAARLARPQGDYWIGIEGGVTIFGPEWLALGWVVLLSKQGLGQARSASYVLPPPLVALMQQGLEQGEADDQIFGTQGAKRRGGTIGAITQQAISRQELYQPAVSMAFAPFLQPELYREGREDEGAFPG